MRTIKAGFTPKIMALTQKERSARFYRNRKENGFCPRCGKPIDRYGHYCSRCLEKVNEYNRETREFCREHHICTACHKEIVYGTDKICYECRAKKDKYWKPLTEEQKMRYGNRFKEQQKFLYQQRKEQGICTRCGKLKAMPGKAKCGVCLAKDAEMHRKQRFNRPNIKEYRKENHLCYYCGNEIDLPKGQLCSNCLERCRQNGIKSGGGNKYWEKDNKLVFKQNKKY